MMGVGLGLESQGQESSSRWWSVILDVVPTSSQELILCICIH